MQPLLTKDTSLVLLATFLFFGSFNVITPTFPVYVSRLGAPETVVGILGGLFTLGAVLQRPFLARMIDKHGKKPVLYIAAFFSCTGPLLYLVSDNLWWLAAARLYHAVSLAAFVVGGQVLLASLAPEGRRGVLMGLFGAASGATMAIFPGLGFYVIERFGYPALFSISALLGLLMVPCTAWVHEPSQRDPLMAPHEAPVIGSLLKNRGVLIMTLGMVSVTIVLGAINAFLPLHAVRMGIENPGGFFTAFAVLFMVGGATSGQLSDSLGRRAVVLPAFLLVSAGAAVLAAAGSYLLLLAAALLIGLGFSSVITVLLAYVMDVTEEHQRSQAISLYNNAFDVGLSAGAMGLGFLATVSFPLLWFVLAVFALVGFLLSVRLM